MSNTNDWTVTMESFRRKGDLLHGWGTLHGTTEAPYAVWLALDDERRIPVIINKTSHFADYRIDIDFVLYCTTRGNGSIQESLDLILEWKDGILRRLPLPPPGRAPAGHGVARFVGLPWKHYFSRGWRLVRQRQPGLLLRKLAGMTSTLLTSGWHPERLLRWAALEGKPLALVIDHDLGGGANLYRRSLLNHLTANGSMPLLLSAHHGILAYQLIARRNNRNRSAHLDDLPSLFAYLSQADVQSVVFNNILSFPAPLPFVDALTSWLQARNTTRFLFLVHDYYCICPAWLLLDHTGTYCGIPDMAVCAVCLPANTAPFLEFSAGVDIASWRATWAKLMDCASEIRCFSETSRRLILRAYPHLESGGRVNVVPHQLDHARLRPIVISDPGWPVIGVIGHLSYHKGGKLVQELAEYILHSESNARIVVVGTIDYPLPPSVATVTGTYRPEQLPDILEKHRVNVGFFSSICPETFSYVTEEMMAMGLPIVALDIGAPGERIAGYKRGHVLPLSPPELLLKHIVAHYQAHVRHNDDR